MKRTGSKGGKVFSLLIAVILVIGISPFGQALASSDEPTDANTTIETTASETTATDADNASETLQTSSITNTEPASTQASETTTNEPIAVSEESTSAQTTDAADNAVETQSDESVSESTETESMATDGEHADVAATGSTTIIGTTSSMSVGTQSISQDADAITPQDYAATRTVLGSPIDTTAKLITMGERKAADTWNGVYSGYIGASEVDNVVVDHFEFHLPQGTEDAAYFSPDYIYLEWNFNEGGDERDTGWSTDYLYKLSDPSSWPANLQQGLKIIQWTDTDIVLEYTYSKSELEWCVANHHYNWQILVKPMVFSKKMVDTTEAAYVPYQASDCLSDRTLGVSQEQYYYDLTYLCDKKTVEIDQQIAPVVNGVVGTYTNDKVYLTPGQTGSVKDTLSRPVGVLDSGDCEVNCTIPSGMTYVSGSATAVSSSGITVAVDDSSGVPVVDFSALPVGQTVTVTFQVTAPTSVANYTEYPTSDTLTNIYQKTLKSNNLFTDPSLRRQPVYSEPEYDTTVSNIFAVVPPTVSKTVTKTWSDSDNAAGIRPDSVTVHLYADGVDTGKYITLDAANNWTGTFTDLATLTNDKTLIDYTVTEDEVAGYSTTITDDGTGNAFTVTNNSQVIPIAGSVSVLLTGDKTMAGRDFQAGDSFTFTIADANAAGTTGYTMPGNLSTTITPTSGTESAFEFEGIDFTKTGTYNFTISETYGTEAGVAYSTSTVNAKVNVTSNATGGLTATIAYSGGDNSAETEKATFTNTYRTGLAEAALAGMKTISGRDFQAGDSFTFELAAEDGNDATGYTMPASTTATVTPTSGTDAAFSFNNISFTKAGTYKFDITEQAGNATNMTYSTAKAVATVTVTSDANGALARTVSYSGGDTASETAKATFTNTYTAATPATPTKTTTSTTAKTGVPKTGDTTPIIPLAILAAAGVSALVIVLVLRRRRSVK